MSTPQYLLDRDCDPSISFFFLQDPTGLHAVRVWKFQPKSLEAAYHAKMRDPKLKGHIVLSKGRGILEFECTPAYPGGKLPEVDKFDLVQLKVVPGSERVVNRREFLRHEFKPPVEALCTSLEEGDAFKIIVKDISAGGMGLAAPAQTFKKGELYRITLPAGCLEAQAHSWPVLIVRDFALSDETLASRGLHGYGAYFVTNKDLVEEGPVFTEGHRSLVIRFVNRASILSRQMGKA